MSLANNSFDAGESFTHRHGHNQTEMQTYTDRQVDEC